MQKNQHDKPNELQQRFIEAYDNIIERAAAALETTRKETAPNIRHLLEIARDKTVEIGELTQEEAEKVAEFIRRDLAQAAIAMEKNRLELTDWLRFDIQLLGTGVAKILERMVDHTRETLDEFAIRADAAGWKTGEVVGPGTLHCKNCQQVLHFHQTGHIPPCPQCQHTLFEREHEVG